MLYTNSDTIASWILKQGYNKLPVCMAKTPLSLTGDPAVKGAPTGFTVPVKNVMVSVGAGFVIPIVGEVIFKLLSYLFYRIQYNLLLSQQVVLLIIWLYSDVSFFISSSSGNKTISSTGISGQAAWIYRFLIVYAD